MPENSRFSNSENEFNFLTYLWGSNNEIINAPELPEEELNQADTSFLEGYGIRSNANGTKEQKETPDISKQ